MYAYQTLKELESNLYNIHDLVHENAEILKGEHCKVEGLIRDKKNLNILFLSH